MHEVSKPAGKAAGDAPPERAARVRQRQRLIDACISALHIHGPSRTTVEKVVALADLSPGIVRFYFDSKDAMLVASLAHLAAEFEERVLVPVGRLRDDPVRALEELVRLYLDPEIASPRKVSVWYCFWGEASSRQEYYEICGKKDDDFAVLVRDLIGRMIGRTHASHLDPDAVALGLIGALEVLWQTIAFQDESQIDREAARERCMAYLRSVFPGTFAGAAAPGRDGAVSAALGDVAGLPSGAYADAALLERERAALLRPAWQLVGDEREIPDGGDFLAGDLPAERALVWRDPKGTLHAFRNACPQRPHALVSVPLGHLGAALHCPAHALTFDWEGRAREGGPGLSALELLRHGPLLFVRGTHGATAPATAPEANNRLVEALARFELPRGARLTRQPALGIRADWKLLIEQWLESASAGAGLERCVLLPNQLLVRTRGALQLLQVAPEAPGRCRVTGFVWSARGAQARSPWPDRWLAGQIAQAESTQLGLTLAPGGAIAVAGGALAEFHRAIRSLLPP